MAIVEEAKLGVFLQWLQANKVELRGCSIKFCGPNKGFGLFSTEDVSGGVLLVVPLDLAITPMRVLQDPLIGPECRAMYEEGEVDDRFLMILFLMLQRLRKNSSWKPYIDILPTTFGNPLWFTDDELLELKGTTLYRATQLQRKNLQSLYDDKVKGLMKKLLILDGDLEGEVCFEDFLWANSLFWSRALNIPLPRSYVFPQAQEDQVSCCSSNNNPEPSNKDNSCEDLLNEKDEKGNNVHGVASHGDTLWVEGLVPGIDFCNHAPISKAMATWEVDGTGLITGIPVSMYLLSGVLSNLYRSVSQPTAFQIDKEISISYGNKGNEELLYLYGFVIEKNPDDFLMVHYPIEAIQNVPFSDSKMQLLEAQKSELRCLLPGSLLGRGFFSTDILNNDKDNCKNDPACNFSWSGQRKTPSYVNKLVFPEEFLTSLRTIAMREDELYKVSSMLEELVGSEGERQPTDAEVRTAVWEACGDSGALQLLVDLLQAKMVDLEENSGTEDSDSELLKKNQLVENPEIHGSSSEASGLNDVKLMSRNKWSSIVYRQGQKVLTRLFLKEAEHALELSLREGN